MKLKQSHKPKIFVAFAEHNVHPVLDDFFSIFFHDKSVYLKDLSMLTIGSEFDVGALVAICSWTHVTILFF